MALLIAVFGFSTPTSSAFSTSFSVQSSSRCELHMWVFRILNFLTTQRWDVAPFPAIFVRHIPLFRRSPSSFHVECYFCGYTLSRELYLQTHKSSLAHTCVGVSNVWFCAYGLKHVSELSCSCALLEHTFMLSASLVLVCFQAASAHYWWSEGGTCCLQSWSWLG